MPSSLRLVSPCTPLSSDFPGLQGCTLCSALGSTTPTIHPPLPDLCKKFGLLCGQARRWTAPHTVSNRVQTSGSLPLYPGLWSRPLDTTLDLRQATSLAVGKGLDPAPHSPLVCGFVWTTPQSQISLLLRLVVARTAHPACSAQSCQVLRVEAGPLLSCSVPSRPDCLLVLSAPRYALASPGRSYLSDSQ